MNSTKQTLIKARALIQKPENWCKFYFACDKQKNPVLLTSPDAYSFCLVGALYKAADSIELHAIRDTVSALVQESCEIDGILASHATHLACVNNTSEHSEILELFDNAINSMGTVK
jgi:hypothetical protein